MPKLIICRGLPASGKTTWARRNVASALQPEYERMCRVNRDDIRQMLHDGTFIKGITEDVVIAVRDASILAALRKGWDVISDDTNLKSRNVTDLLKLAAKTGAEVEFKDFTDVSVDECVRRDTKRGLDDPLGINKWVGEDVILDQYNRFIKGRTIPLPIPELKEQPSFEPVQYTGGRYRRSAVIVDIDGTVAHNPGHRGFYEYDKVYLDKPKRDVIEVVSALDYCGYDVIFLSGREDVCRPETAEWIVDNVLRIGHGLFESHSERDNAIRLLSYDNDKQSSGKYRLLMRRAADHRDDALVKYELYRDFVAPEFDVKLVLDDRLRVVRMWHQIGLTVLRVGDPDADF